jgi:hypothetical protein
VSRDVAVPGAREGAALPDAEIAFFDALDLLEALAVNEADRLAVDVLARPTALP